MNDWVRYVEALRACETGADAVEVTLRRLLTLTHSALESATEAWWEAKVRRAILHLRPGESYQGLFVLESGAEGLHGPRSGDALAPSLSTWRSVQRTGTPVALDVTLRALTPRLGTMQVAEGPGAEVSAMSGMRLEAREVSHLYAVPLFAAADLIGMVSLELFSQRAVGRELPWDSIADDLELAASVAGPHLAALPPAETPARDGDPLLPVVGATMAGVVDVLGAFASEPETLLIRGETGVGKSRIARWCHAHSPRADGPFEVLDLLAVPEETQMGELFGWKRGAFTGAVSDHAGFVGRADKGTLFLDEIDKLSPKAQAALLTLIEERTYRPLGTSNRMEADVRFVVGTNVDLPTEVREGRFREDLYYRINVLPIELPPLRRRSDEIAAWARFMLERRHVDKGASGSATLDEDAAESLRRQPWPGNLRQLDNIVRRAHALASSSAAEGGSIRVTSSHVERAWGLDPGAASEPTGAGTPLTSLRSGAAALARAMDGADLDGLDLPRALHGVLLAEAVVQTGSREAAFELLGRRELVANRNHHKAFKRDVGHARALFTALGESIPEDLEPR